MEGKVDRYCVACKLSNKNIENCDLECIPSSLADQIVIDLTRNEGHSKLQSWPNVHYIYSQSRGCLYLPAAFPALAPGRPDNSQFW